MLAAVMLVLGGIAYAFFMGGLGDIRNETAKIQTGTLALTFSDLDGASLKIEKSLWFGDTVEKEFKIENTGTLDAYAKIMWDDLVNTYLQQSLSYTLEYKSLQEEQYQSVKTVGYNVPRSDSSSLQDLSYRMMIPAGETYTYKLTITLEDLSVIDQTQDLTAKFSTKFTIKEDTPSVNELMSRDIDWDNFDEEHIYSILYNYDEDGNMSSMFRCCSNLASLDVNHFNTSKTIYMRSMFDSCRSLTSLDLSNFDTSNVTSMRGMFYGCTNLTSLDVSNFDTSNVTDMDYMFHNVPSTIKIIVRNAELKTWIIDASDSPKLTDSNFIVS